jgi:hypothetical protein
MSAHIGVWALSVTHMVTFGAHTRQRSGLLLHAFWTSEGSITSDGRVSSNGAVGVRGNRGRPQSARLGLQLPHVTRS